MKRDLQYNNRKNFILNYCKVCFGIERLERHRIIVGGPYSIENVICLCKTHHTRIHKLLKTNENTPIDELIRIMKQESGIEN
jgi:hypothetical protein